MPRKKVSPNTAAANEEQSDKLAATVEALTTQVEALTGQVAIAELTDAFNRNRDPIGGQVLFPVVVTFVA